jgi:dienelactone hydrolase
MRHIIGGAALALALATANIGHAAPPPIEAYGQLPAIDQISLSPSGQYMVSIGDVDGKRYILARTVAGAVQLAVPADKVKVRGITWVDDRHVIVQITVTKYNYVDLDRSEYGVYVNIDIANKKSNVLFSHEPRFEAANARLIATYVIGGKPYAYLSNIGKEGKVNGSLLEGQYDADHYWPDLWRIDLTTNFIERVAHGTIDIDNWAVDPSGGIAGYSNFYNKTSTWALYHGETRLMQNRSVREEVSLEGLGRVPGSMLVHDASGAEDKWIEIAADGKAQTLWDGENVTNVLRSGATGLVIGALIDNARWAFFDPNRQARIDAAEKPFKGTLTLESATDALDKVILHTGGQGDSGTVYLIDMASHSASVIANDYPDVPPDQVGQVRKVSYKAADGTVLDGVLTLPAGKADKNLPVVVLPHGGPIGIYDIAEFNWMAQAFASRGYAVFQPNYRGSGGHGAAFQNAGFGEWGRKMLTDTSDGLADLAKQGIVDPKRACIVGFSYGGYAALAGVTVQQGLYRCAVSGSGVSDLPNLLQWQRNRRGQEDKYDREAMGVTVPGAPSLDSISPARLASRADAPVLLIHGTDDSVVPIEQSQEMNDALKRAGKSVEFLITKDEDHWLSNASTRTQTLKAAVAFVQKYNPAD